MRLSVAAIAFVAVLAAAATADDIVADKKSKYKSEKGESVTRAGEDTTELDSTPNDLSQMEAVLSPYIRNVADGSNLQEFEGRLVIRAVRARNAFPEPELRLMFPNGLSVLIINLPPADQIGLRTGGETIVIKGQITSDGSAIDAMNNIPEILVTEDDHITGPEGNRSILMVRVNANDASESSTESSISNLVFGTGGGSPSASEQIAACSYDKLTFSPATGTDIGTGTEAGTTTITVGVNFLNEEISPTGFGSGIEGQITMALNTKYGSLPGYTSPADLADHVMYCIAPGTLDNGEEWFAYAYFSPLIDPSPGFPPLTPWGWLSVHNDGGCLSLSGIIHEFGHNINLAHANDLEFATPMNSIGEYEDYTGYMGGEIFGQENARKCFNGPKSWQTGWYQDRHETIEAGDLNSNCQRQIQLLGISEYNLATGDEKVIVMVTAPVQNTEYHIIFNRANGMNADTGSEPGEPEYTKVRDKVLITSRDEHDGSYYDEYSNLDHALSQGEAVTIPDFNGIVGTGLTITVETIDTTVTPGVANILIKYGDCTSAPSPSPSTAPSVTRTTEKPSASPSVSPSSPPTPLASGSPSATPSAGPSPVPSPLASSSPSSSPTSENEQPSASPSSSPAPSASPTATASANPTTSMSPSDAPSNIPSRAPTTSPSDAPTQHPSSSPTNTPSASPSSAPSAAPTISQAPSSSPSASPSGDSDEPSSQPSAAPTSCPTGQVFIPTNYWVPPLDKPGMSCQHVRIKIPDHGEFACLPIGSGICRDNGGSMSKWRFGIEEVETPPCELSGKCPVSAEPSDTFPVLLDPALTRYPITGTTFTDSNTGQICRNGYDEAIRGCNYAGTTHVCIGEDIEANANRYSNERPYMFFYNEKTHQFLYQLVCDGIGEEGKLPQLKMVNHEALADATTVDYPIDMVKFKKGATPYTDDSNELWKMYVDWNGFEDPATRRRGKLASFIGVAHTKFCTEYVSATDRACWKEDCSNVETPAAYERPGCAI